MVDERRRWLIAEDDEGVRNLLAMMMKAWDIEPFIFNDGFEIMAWLDRVEQTEVTRGLPELALLDIRMPGASGTEIARRLRDIEATSHMVIVLLTAYRLFPDEKERIEEEVGPDLIFYKPLPSLDKFKAQVEAVLALRRDGDQN